DAQRGLKRRESTRKLLVLSKVRAQRIVRRRCRLRCYYAFQFSGPLATPIFLGSSGLRKGNLNGENNPKYPQDRPVHARRGRHFFFALRDAPLSNATTQDYRILVKGNRSKGNYARSASVAFGEASPRGHDGNKRVTPRSVAIRKRGLRRI